MKANDLLVSSFVFIVETLSTSPYHKGRILAEGKEDPQCQSLVFWKDPISSHTQKGHARPLNSHVLGSLAFGLASRLPCGQILLFTSRKWMLPLAAGLLASANGKKVVSLHSLCPEGKTSVLFPGLSYCSGFSQCCGSAAFSSPFNIHFLSSCWSLLSQLFPSVIFFCPSMSNLILVKNVIMKQRLWGKLYCEQQKMRKFPKVEFYFKMS